MSMKTLAISCLLSVLMACSASRTNSNGGAGAGAGTSGGGTAGAAGAPNPTGEGTGCSTDGATRSCCSTGTQLCSGTVEFLAWGACLDAKGVKVVCGGGTTPSGCGVGEFGPNCTKLVDAGVPHYCGNGEFPPNCVLKPGDGGTTSYCAPGDRKCMRNQPALCGNSAINTEPQILVGYSPSAGQSVGATGQIKVWVNDERPELISPNEVIDATTGAITTPGDRSAKAVDGYLWEPALYISPQTAESGGTPHFPQVIKGWYNNMPPVNGATFNFRAPVTGTQVPGLETPPPGTQLTLQYSTEIIWDVAALGLTPGTYTAEFVIHDGDRDRGIGCVTITITQ